ncbi:NPCBM/NEW2 domain-containing protein [Planotetraspora sp. GP83]|uniref:NPCBM/NEW2 domain-containing protein n=1 Tax=Planotetraspora sp. GP83 TaxID=3156264 RepID=UPI0035196189
MRRALSAIVIAATVCAFSTVAAVTPEAAIALDDGQALTPPMGFNNWNSTGCAIDEKMIRDMADFFVTSGLKQAGYDHVNVDDCWAAPERDPGTGRLRAHPERFPSGIKALADYVHSKGLKFGIYTSAGTQTCAKTMPGALDHEEVDAQTFADWGVDYLKYDNCNNEGRPALERYTKMRDALKKTGRPIVFSICEWGQNKPWEWGKDVGHLWRTTGDISDGYVSMLNIFKLNAPLAPYAGPGHWNDPDMLEVGNGGMTDAEYRSHMSLWSIMAAPLLIGTDLRKATPQTMEILLNKDVIGVDQDPLGVQGRVLRNDDGHWIMVKPLKDGDVAVALFNETDTTATFGTTAQELGLPRRPAYVLRDLWRHKEAETAGAISATVPGHATVMYRVRPRADWWRTPPAADLGLVVSPTVAGIPGTITPPGRAFTAKVTTTNLGRIPLILPSLRLSAPTGWSIQPDRPARRATLGTGQSLSAEWRVTPPASAPPGTAGLTATLTSQNGPSRNVTEALTVPAAPPAGTSDLGAVAWAWASNGYGPVEHDMSNGGPKPGDGKPMKINGVAYPKGLGTHAPVQIVFYLAGRCTGLTTDVGVDDERDPRTVPGQSTITAEVWADDAKRADSGLRTWQDPATTLTADLTGATFLRLVGTVGGDTNSYDRIDWAGPVLTCKAA